MRRLPAVRSAMVIASSLLSWVRACQPAVIPCAYGGLVNALGVLEDVPRVWKSELQPVFIGE